MSDDAPQQEVKSGAPAWVMTFADLMSLLLTFFILLLSFAEIDATKFRKISGSLKMAFGVQRTNVFDEPPAGSSMIMQNHSAGSGASRSPMSTSSRNVALLDPQLQAIKKKQEKENRAAIQNREKLLKANVKKIWAKLSQEIKEGKIEITHKDGNLIIRVAEDATFPDGRAKLNSSFTPLLEKLSEILAEVKGDITVAGHTDDKKIKNSRYKNSWELSSARAMAFANGLMAKGGVSESRIVISAFGATRPMVRNNSAINRKKNRRVEVIIKH